MSAHADALDRALSRGLDFLARRQLPDGEFSTFVSPDREMRADCLFESTPFTTALLAYSLRFAGSDTARAMRAKAIAFLIGEKEGPGVWRFWSSKDQKHASIPLDLDDTCCSAFAIRDHGGAPPPNTGAILANRNPEGLFYTWLIPRRTTGSLLYWRAVLREARFCRKQNPFWLHTEACPDDIDCVVNANAVAYLGEREETRAAIRYLLQTLSEQREGRCDKWHLNRFTYYYMASRAYFSGVPSLVEARAPIVDRITQAAATVGRMGNALDTALGACSLLNYGEHSSVLREAVQHLAGTQGGDGSWPKLAFYYGGPKRVYGWGSEELTTGFCVEALARYRALL